MPEYLPQYLTANLAYLKSSHDRLKAGRHSEDEYVSELNLQRVGEMLIRSYNQLTIWLTNQIGFLLKTGKIPDGLVDDYFRAKAQAELDFIRDGIMEEKDVPRHALVSETSLRPVGQTETSTKVYPLQVYDNVILTSYLPNLIAHTISQLYKIKPADLLPEDAATDPAASRLQPKIKISDSHPIAVALEHLTKLILIEPWVANCENGRADVFGIPVSTEDEAAYEAQGHVATSELVNGGLEAEELSEGLIAKITDLVTDADPEIAEYAHVYLNPRRIGRASQVPYLKILSSFVQVPDRYEDKLVETYLESLRTNGKEELWAGFALGSIHSLGFNDELYAVAVETILKSNNWKQRFVAARILSKMDYPQDFLDNNRDDARELLLALLEEEFQNCDDEKYTVAFYLTRVLAKLLEPDKSVLMSIIGKANNDPRLDALADLLLVNLPEKNKVSIAQELITDLDDPDYGHLFTKWFALIGTEQDIERLASKIRAEELVSEEALLCLVDLCDKYSQDFPQDLQIRLTVIQRQIFDSLKAEEDPVYGRVAVPQAGPETIHPWDALGKLLQAGPAASPVVIGLLQHHSSGEMALNADRILHSFDYRVIRHIEDVIRSQHQEGEDYKKVPMILSLLGVIASVLQDTEFSISEQIDYPFTQGRAGDCDNVIGILTEAAVPYEVKERATKLLCDIYAGTSDAQLKAAIATVIEGSDMDCSIILAKLELEDFASPRVMAAKELSKASRYYYKVIQDGYKRWQERIILN